MRWDVINHLIEKNNYKTYLEIGYYKGWSFDNVKCEEKTAVDPNPCKTPEQEEWRYGMIAMLSENEGVLKMTSDEFFSIKNITEGHFGKGEKDTWDIIFIDGLHEAKQVTKDIENSLKFLSSGGTIVLHDCNPPKYEHTTTGIDGCWTGDVYKAVARFRAEYPQHELYTVDIDWGVGVISYNDTGFYYGINANTEVSVTDVMEVSDNWKHFDENRERILNLISYQDFIRKIKGVKPRNETVKDNNSSAE